MNNNKVFSTILNDLALNQDILNVNLKYYENCLTQTKDYLVQTKDLMHHFTSLNELKQYENYDFKYYIHNLIFLVNLANCSFDANVLLNEILSNKFIDVYSDYIFNQYRFSSDYDIFKLCEKDNIIDDNEAIYLVYFNFNDKTIYFIKLNWNDFISIELSNDNYLDIFKTHTILVLKMHFDYVNLLTNKQLNIASNDYYFSLNNDELTISFKNNLTKIENFEQDSKYVIKDFIHTTNKNWLDFINLKYVINNLNFHTIQFSFNLNYFSLNFEDIFHHLAHYFSGFNNILLNGCLILKIVNNIYTYFKFDTINKNETNKALVLDNNDLIDYLSQCEKLYQNFKEI